MADTNSGARLGHRPALDGLRGVAVLLVFLSHMHVIGFTDGGLTGVTAFFTLSGFLITTLLLEEQSRTGKVRLGRFYLRRAGRLLPALAAVAAVVFACEWSAGHPAAGAADVAIAVGYATNWVRAFGGSAGYMDHTWSLAIEEQFYLVWPAVMLRITRHHGLAALRRLLIVGIVLSISIRGVLLAQGAVTQVAYRFDTRADALLVGCLLACIRAQIGRLPASRIMMALAAIAFGGMTCGVLGWGASGYWWALLVTPWATAALICCSVADAAPIMLGGRMLRLAGRRSYGFYLCHIPIYWVVWTEPWPWATRVLVVTTASVVCTAASWQWVERPALTWIRGRSGEQESRDEHLEARGVRAERFDGEEEVVAVCDLAREDDRTSPGEPGGAGRLGDGVENAASGEAPHDLDGLHTRHAAQPDLADHEERASLNEREPLRVGGGP